MKILHVEDDPDNGSLVVRLLQKFGHEIVWIPSVAGALERLQSQQFDLLLVDLGLAECDGIDFIRTVRSMGTATPAAAVTGYGRAADVAACMEAGFNLHITKPIVDLDGFVTKLEELVATTAKQGEEAGS